MAGSDTGGVTKRKRPELVGKTGPKGSWKMTPEVIGKLEQAFAIDATIEEACHYADINPSTYHDWKNKNPELSKKMERLRLNPVLAARQTISKAIQNDPNYAFKFMERKRRKEYAPQLNLADSEGKNMPAPILNIFANIGQETVDDTKRDVIEAEITEVEIDEQRNSMSEIRGKTLPATPSDDIKEHKLNGNIMDDING